MSERFGYSPEDEQMRAVRGLIGHIMNPCRTVLTDGTEVDLREFYLTRARELLPTLTDMNAKGLLQYAIGEYSRG